MMEFGFFGDLPETDQAQIKSILSSNHRGACKGGKQPEFSWIKYGNKYHKSVQPIKAPALKEADDVSSKDDNVTKAIDLDDPIEVSDVEVKSEMPAEVHDETIDSVGQYTQEATIQMSPDVQQHGVPLNMVPVQAPMGYPMPAYPVNFFQPGFTPPGMIPHPHAAAMPGMIPITYLTPHGPVAYGMAPLPVSMTQEQIMTVMQQNNFDNTGEIMPDHMNMQYHYPHDEHTHPNNSSEEINLENRPKSTARAHERRNKKKRPPDYYQKLEQEKTTSSLDSDSSYKQLSDASSVKSQSPGLGKQVDTDIKSMNPPSVPSETQTVNSEEPQNQQSLNSVHNNNYATEFTHRSSGEDISESDSNNITSLAHTDSVNITQKLAHTYINDSNNAPIHSCSEGSSNSGVNFNQQIPQERTVNMSDVSDNSCKLTNTDGTTTKINHSSSGVESVIVSKEIPMQSTNKVDSSNIVNSSDNDSSDSQTNSKPVIGNDISSSDNVQSNECVETEKKGDSVTPVREVETEKLSVSVPNDSSNEGNMSSDSVVKETGNVTYVSETVSQVKTTTEAASATGHPAVAAALAKKPNSWAGLFSGTKQAQNATVIYVGSNDSKDKESAQGKGDQKPEEKIPAVITTSEDSLSKLIGEVLTNHKLNHKVMSLQPRGLKNRRNWCYVSATLQALLACPPFYHLMKALPYGPKKKKVPTATLR